MKFDSLIKIIDPSFVPQEDIVLTDRCKNARSKWWRLWFNYDYITQCVVKSMNIQNKPLEEIKCYIKTRQDNFYKNHPYPVDEIQYRFYTDYVPF